jgi:hypothetical protein
MKLFLKISLLSAFLFGCEENVTELKRYTLEITGIKESIEIESGRTNEENQIDKVYLKLAIAGTLEIVYEKSFEDSIPDTISFIGVEEGDYDLYSYTVRNWQVNFDSATYKDQSFKIESFAVDTNPIFASFTTFSLTENQTLNVEMKHLSTKIKYRLKDNQSFETDDDNLIVSTQANQFYFDFTSASLIAEENPQYSGLSLNFSNSVKEHLAYEFPKEIYAFKFNFRNKFQTQLEAIVYLDNPVQLEINDEITFIFDKEAILEGASRGIFNFEDIVWVDKGEVIVD